MFQFVGITNTINGIPYTYAIYILDFFFIISKGSLDGSDRLADSPSYILK